MQIDFLALAADIGKQLRAHDLMLCVAESCTGGQLAQVITSVAGSSNWFERGFVTYSNEAKQEMLGVKENIISRYGAVSEQTAHAMAEGALRHSHADLSIAITGIAGPDGGTAEKPVGTVWFAWAGKNIATQTQHQQFSGDRIAISDQAVQFALKVMLEILTTRF